MKHLPKIFPIGLLTLLVSIVFVGAYALSENAITGVESAGAATANRFEEDTDGDFGDHVYDWYEDAAIFICPLH